MYYLKKFIDLILYGNFWIALGALAMCLQSQLLINGVITLSPLSYFVFFSTLFLYAVHRIVGISKLHEYFEVERYGVIVNYKSHIRIYAIVGLLGATWFFLMLSSSMQMAVIIPALLSMGYAMPFLSGKKKRLRDFHNVKIFLIAGVWAMVTVGLPALKNNPNSLISFILLFLERAIFIFAITLPFDIRDLKVDAHSDVRTIPAKIGERKSRQLGLACILLVFFLSLGNFFQGLYTIEQLAGMTISLVLTALLIQKSTADQHDYFYSGLMDGTMILQFLLVWAGTVIN